MNISSVVLRTKPEKLQAVRAQLTATPGIDICAALDDGCVVLTIEDTVHGSANDAYVHLHDIDGVLNASLVYQYSDDALPQEPEQ
ncbi:MAG TPA: chaperone NapD [Burkholderiales bacterium]|nr:chaperone NapD [Burkholderiales bacterium]